MYQTVYTNPAECLLVESPKLNSLKSFLTTLQPPLEIVFPLTTLSFHRCTRISFPWNSHRSPQYCQRRYRCIHFSMPFYEASCISLMIDPWTRPSQPPSIHLLQDSRFSFLSTSTSSVKFKMISSLLEWTPTSSWITSFFTLIFVSISLPRPSPFVRRTTHVWGMWCMLFERVWLVSCCPLFVLVFIWVISAMNSWIESVCLWKN